MGDNMAKNGYAITNRGKKSLTIHVTTDRKEIKAIQKANKRKNAIANMQDKKFRIDKKRTNRAYRSTVVSPLLKIILLVLIVFAVIAFLRFGDINNALSFDGLLSFLQNVPTVNYNWLNIADVSLNLPDWLGWLNTVINFLSSVIEFFGFLLAGIWQALNFILYFLRYLFLG